MLIVDIVAAIIVVGACLAVPAAIHLYRLNRPNQKLLDRAEILRARGQLNAVQSTLDRERVCWSCSKITDPSVDLHVAGAWVHRTCHENITKGNP